MLAGEGSKRCHAGASNRLLDRPLRQGVSACSPHPPPASASLPPLPLPFPQRRKEGLHELATEAIPPCEMAQFAEVHRLVDVDISAAAVPFTEPIRHGLEIDGGGGLER